MAPPILLFRRTRSASLETRGENRNSLVAFSSDPRYGNGYLDGYRAWLLRKPVTLAKSLAGIESSIRISVSLLESGTVYNPSPSARFSIACRGSIQPINHVSRGPHQRHGHFRLAAAGGNAIDANAGNSTCRSIPEIALGASLASRSCWLSCANLVCLNLPPPAMRAFPCGLDSV